MDSTLKKLYVYSADLIEVDNNKPQDFDLYEIEARSSLVCFARPFYTILQRKSTHLCA